MHNDNDKEENMFWDMIVYLCSEKNISPNAMCNDLKLSNATATHWKKGAVPRDVTLKKIANYFDVSVDYLLGKTDEHNASQKEPSTDDSLKKLHELVDKISKEYRDDAEEILELYVKKSMEKNNKKNTASISDSGIKHKD